MEEGKLTMSEIEELFVLQDEYEINGSTYRFYAQWNQGFPECISAGTHIIIYISIYQHI